MEYEQGWRSMGPIHLLENTPGLTDVYEFGVFHGNSTVELSLICDAVDLTCDHLVGFDSFDGIPKETQDPLSNPDWDPDRSHFFRAWNAKLYFDVETPTEAMQKVYDFALPYIRSPRRLTLVPGFYDQVLTDDLPKELELKKALIVDIDCDTYSSSKTVLQWLFKNKLVDVGTYVFYDDWGGTPGYQEMASGESRAHREITEEYEIEWDFIGSASGMVPHSQVIWRIKSIGIQ